MAQLFLLLFLVPVIVAPVVLLIGFAGCQFHKNPENPPNIISATGTGVGTIRLTWMIDQPPTGIEFTRTQLDPLTLMPVGMRVSFTRSPVSPADDSMGLAAGTPYQYTAVAQYPDGPSGSSPSVIGTTLPPPTFDARGGGGAGSTSGGNDIATASWSHTASGDARAVVVGLRWTQPGFLLSQVPVRTATYGGTQMNSTSVIGLNNAVLSADNATFQELFGLLNPPPGAQTVTVTVTRQGQGLAAALTLEANSVSYTEVSGFGAVSSIAGHEAGTSLSQTVSAAPNETVVQMFTTASGPITNSNQTVRVDDGAHGIVIAEAPGAASISFTANCDANVDFAGQAVALLPIT